MPTARACPTAARRASARVGPSARTGLSVVGPVPGHRRPRGPVTAASPLSPPSRRRPTGPPPPRLPLDQPLQPLPPPLQVAQPPVQGPRPVGDDVRQDRRGL